MAASTLGIRVISRSDDHENVENDTTNIKPTNEATGTDARRGAVATIPKARREAMKAPLSRVVPPLFTLISDWPRRAQPPIPPVRPERILPTPRAVLSREVEPWVPSERRSSTSCDERSESHGRFLFSALETVVELSAARFV